MKFSINNLGIVKNAEVELGHLTIICGKNNCGKTYSTYALYSFLHTVVLNLRLPLTDKCFNELLKNGSCKYDANQIWPDEYNKKLQSTLEKFVSFIPFALAIPPAGVTPITTFDASVNDEDFSRFIEQKMKLTIQVSEKCRISLEKEQRNSFVKFSLINLGNRLPNKDVLRDSMSTIFSIAINAQVLPDVFSVSSERTGVFLFAQELGIIIHEHAEKNKKKITRKIENEEMDVDLKPSPYPLPVLEEIRFAMKIKTVIQKESFIQKHYPEILDCFDDIAGGKYKVDEVLGIQFIIPEKRPLSLSESSSSVKSLVELNFYLRYCAKKGQVLMIDEPELNLHPASQRKLARLLAMLVNAGIKVFITTHSDYIVREFNTLLQLNNDDEYLRKLQKEEGYKDEELLKADKVKAYVAEKQKDGVVLKAAPVTQHDGITIDTLDEVIDKMNQIHDAIIWGE